MEFERCSRSFLIKLVIYGCRENVFEGRVPTESFSRQVFISKGTNAEREVLKFLKIAALYKIRGEPTSSLIPL